MCHCLLTGKVVIHITKLLKILNIFSPFQDLEYWGVDVLYLEACCVQRYYQQRELLNWDHQVKKEELEVFRPGRLGRLQKVLWDLFEKPHTSIGARVSKTSRDRFESSSGLSQRGRAPAYFDPFIS